MATRKKAKRTKKPKVLTVQEEFVKDVMRAARRATRTARKIAKMHGTPIVYMRDGKIIEEYL